MADDPAAAWAVSVLRLPLERSTLTSRIVCSPGCFRRGSKPRLSLPLAASSQQTTDIARYVQLRSYALSRCRPRQGNRALVTGGDVPEWPRLCYYWVAGKMEPSASSLNSVDIDAVRGIARSRLGSFLSRPVHSVSHQSSSSLSGKKSVGAAETAPSSGFIVDRGGAAADCCNWLYSL